MSAGCSFFETPQFEGPKSISRVSQESFKGVSRVFQGLFKEISKDFGSFRSSSWKFQGCSGVFQNDFVEIVRLMRLFFILTVSFKEVTELLGVFQGN